LKVLVREKFAHTVAIFEATIRAPCSVDDPSGIMWL
jgi:hypothetical protein